MLFVVFLLYGKEIMGKYDLTSFNITDPNSEDREIIIENLTKCKNIIEESESKIKKKEELESILKNLKVEEEKIKYDSENIEDKLKASPEIENKITNIIIISTIVGLFFYLIGGVVTFFISSYLTNKYMRKPYVRMHQKELEKEYKEKLSKRTEELNNKLASTNKKLSDVNGFLESLEQSNELVVAKNFMGSEEFFDKDTINCLIDLIKSKRADTFKEAINLLDELKHRERLEQQQGEMLEVQGEMLEVNKAIKEDTGSLRFSQDLRNLRDIIKNK